MSSASLTYRLILLALLPCLAAILYAGGQSYDPALIDFKTVNGKSTQPDLSEKAVSSPEPAGKTVPAAGTKDLAGFRLSGKELHYTKDNLFEHVDGHAEYFISAGFKGLTVSEYAPAGGSASRDGIEVEVYDMGKSIQAFGVLSDESGDNAKAAPVGTMGFRTSGGINFIKGGYYVKISSFDPKIPILGFAKAFSETISAGPGGSDSFSKAFSGFPDLGRAGKTRFIKEGYRGLDFLRNVIERDYTVGDKKITVALMPGSVQETKALLTSFMDYFNKSGIQYDKTEKNGYEVYKVMDKYEGNWLLIPGHDTIVAVFGSDDVEILKHFAKRKG